MAPLNFTRPKFFLDIFSAKPSGAAGSGARGGAQNNMKLLSLRMTRKNTLNKVHVAATELGYRSCYRRIQICLERQPHKVTVVFVQL